MKEQRNLKKVFGLALLVIVIAFMLIITGTRADAEALTYAIERSPFFEASYRRYLERHGFIAGVTQLAQGEVFVDVFNFETSAGMNAFPVDGGVRTGELGIISWQFYVETAGFYNLEVSYIPEAGTNSQIRRIITLNGELLHNALRQAAFNRTFENSKIEKRNNNEIRPRAIEIFVEQSVFIADSQRRSLDPFIFYLSQGQHTLSFESIREPMIITGIRFAAAPAISTYNDFRAELASAPVAVMPYTGRNLVFQAERAVGSTLNVRRSLPSIAVRSAFFEPSLIPFHPYRIVFNTIGGETWRSPGDIIEWDIYVPEEGLYKISFKGRQSVNRGVISYRSLKINRVTPFIEAQSLGFSFSASMRNYILGGDEPFLFHFQRGINTLSMEVVLGDFGGPYAEVSESVMILNDLYRRIIQITGTVPDRFIDYQVPLKIPDFVPILRQEHDRLSRVVEELNRITIERGTNTAMVERIVVQMYRLFDRPDNITLELNQFRANITMLASWLVTVAEMPLEVASFTLMAYDSQPYPARSNFARRSLNSLVRFFATFFIDMTAIDTDVEGRRGALTVWFPTGRDQAQVLRSLIDERFIPEYGISVNLQLVPIDVVVPAALAGVGPDVVLNLDQTRLMDFALRNALVEMSALPGFEEEASRFFPSALEGITFQGRTFGLPETQTFLMMFYRRDILDSLGLTPPRTWEEFRNVIPVFHMNNFDVWVPNPGHLASLIFQKGGNLYLGEGDDFGITSGLLEEPTMRAFEEFTNFFTAYRLPFQVDFGNRFRTGEVPLGIADYTEYWRLELFAPEIRGLWSFAPLPGVKREDGTIDNRVVTATTQTVVLRAAQERDIVDDAWAFVRWWMSTEIQTEFAHGLEAILGPSARYPTANPEVLVRLPWAATDANILLEQFASTISFPQVPGHYMTTRMIDYAFRAVVTRGANPRQTLFMNTRAINHELTRKRREFSLSYIDHGGRR